jgi:hypothetical protein
MYEFEATIPTLWGHVMGMAYGPRHLFVTLIDTSIVTDFALKHPEYIAKDNALGFMSPDSGATYNLCHCQSFSLLFPTLTLNPNQSGVISKLQTWISGEVRLT